MKVLHIAINGESNPPRQLALENALQSLAEPAGYRQINWVDIRQANGIPYLRNLIKNVSAELNPDLTFMQIQTPGVLDPGTVRSIPGFVVNWTGDVRQPTPQWYFEIAAACDLTLFTNMHDVRELKKKGLKAAFLNIGFDQNIFNPYGSKGSYPEIVFLGREYAGTFPLSPFRKNITDTLIKRYGSRFQIYGNRFNNGLNMQKEAECYRSCKVAINISHFDLSRYSSDRMLRIMGSGAFCLTHDYKDLFEDFSIHKHVASFTDAKDLMQKIDYYLEHTRERQEIAEKGCKLVHERDTWKARMEELKILMDGKL